MPALFPLPSEVPANVRRAQAALSPVTRLLVAKYIYQHPASSRAQIMDDLGMSSDTVRKALRELISAGLLGSSSPVDDRRGQQFLTYTLDNDGFDRDMAAWLKWFREQ